MEHIQKDYIGPGIWYMIHKSAALAIDDKNKLLFLTIIEWVKDNFPCEICRQHIQQYVVDNPPIKYFNERDGLFIWSWEFHNVVNKRLNKPYMPYKEAYEIYHSDNNKCSKCLPTSRRYYF